MTSADNGEAPELMSLTRPPSLVFILLNTNLSHIGDGFRPLIIACLLALYAVQNNLSFSPPDSLTAFVIAA
uniref:Uncharacterized protein n=1 Tax=Arundo donax TaxID=35708 RepID=A0A0A9D6B6_ARUDO